jgi:hypothetical protein
VNLSIQTRRRGGEDSCPACIRDRDGGLGPRVHTCLTHQTPGQIASRQRAEQLAKLDRNRQRAR